MWTNETDYMNSWVWRSVAGGYYCRITGERFASRHEAEETVRRKDREAGILWPWQRALVTVSGCRVLDLLLGKE